MNDTFFRSGNYNNWYNFITKTLVSREEFLSKTIIPSIDNILLKMLGPTSPIEKSSINAYPILSRTSIKGIKYSLIYTIKDFMVPEAPTKAVQEDTEAIKKCLTFEGYNFTEVSINIQNGELKISFETYFEEN